MLWQSSRSLLCLPPELGPAPAGHHRAPQAREREVLAQLWQCRPLHPLQVALLGSVPLPTDPPEWAELPQQIAKRMVVVALAALAAVPWAGLGLVALFPMLRLATEQVVVSESGCAVVPSAVPIRPPLSPCLAVALWVLTMSVPSEVIPQPPVLLTVLSVSVVVDAPALQD